MDTLSSNSKKGRNILYYTAAPQAKKIWVILALVQTNRVGTSAPQARNFADYARLCMIFLLQNDIRDSQDLKNFRCAASEIQQPSFLTVASELTI